MNTVDLDLPYLQEIFGALRMGKHLCLEDTLLYGSLLGRYVEYKALFDALGLRMEKDKWGNIFMVNDASPAAAERIIYFMAILIEWMDDKGESIRESVDHARRVYRIVDLPHLTIPKYSDLMAKVVDIKGAQGIQAILKSMSRYGFAELFDDGGFRLRPPCHRLIDICSWLGRDLEAQGTIGNESEEEDPFAEGDEPKDGNSEMGGAE